MNENNLNEKINSAFTHAVPDVLDNILTECKTASQKEEIKMNKNIAIENGNVVEFKVKKNNSKKNFLSQIMVTAAALLLVVVGLVGYNRYTITNSVDSVIGIDVNPSIELEVNANEKVLAVRTLNDDAKIILADMELEGTQLDVAVNALIGSMLKNGYISEIANSILVTVENDDAAKSTELEQRLMENVNLALASNSISGAVIIQTAATSDEELVSIASQYGISLGKAKLVRSIAALDSTLSIEVLSAMSINELKLLAETRNLQLEDAVLQGNASAKSYITKEQAEANAMANVPFAGEAYTIRSMYTELDYDNGRMIYEVEIIAEVTGAQTIIYECDFDVDAITGDILKAEVDQDNVIDPTQIPDGPEYITSEQAESIAVEHARAQEEPVAAAEHPVYDMKVEFDYDNGRAHYDVEFVFKLMEYDYEINAITGEIIKFESEAVDDSPNNTTVIVTPLPSQQTPTPGAAQNYISRDAATLAAFTHAGIAQMSNIFDIEVEFDEGDRDESAHYEIDFKYGKDEYSYEIDAVTGSVIKFEKETDDDDDDDDNVSVNTGSTNYIGSDAAKAAAFAHAGLSQATNLSEIEVEFDEGDANEPAHYEVDFNQGADEYSYEIDAVTGSVLRFEKDIDDDINDIDDDRYDLDDDDDDRYDIDDEEDDDDEDDDDEDEDDDDDED